MVVPFDQIRFEDWIEKMDLVERKDSMALVGQQELKTVVAFVSLTHPILSDRYLEEKDRYN